MNFKKILLGSVAVVAAVVSLAPANASMINDPEFDSALTWMSENGLTKYNTAESFQPYATLTREQAAKFLSTFAVTNLCLETVDSASCDFSDVPADPSLGEYVSLACELGLVKGSAGKYMPTAPMTKAAVITVLSRAMAAAEGKDAPSEDVAPRWSNHLTAARAAGITKETNAAALDRSVTRYEVALMLYRARVDAAECSDVNVEDLLNDLFGDDTTTVTTGDDTTTVVVTESNGTAKAMLSSSTLNGATIPGGVSVKAASFTVSATDEDVVVTDMTFKRMGLGDSSTVKKLSLYANNDVVSKSKSFNSDEEVLFSLSPAVTVKKGTTVTFDVVVTAGDVASSANEEFAISLVDFNTNGKEDKANLAITANTFRVGGVNGASVKVTRDGNISDVNLGDTGVEVAKIQLDNNSNNNVTITQITIKDDQKNADEDLKNFVLKHKGTTIATTAMANGKYVTFILSTPLSIAKNESEDLRVYADVVAGAGDTIDFTIDQEIYVIGTDAQYGYGIAVNLASYLPANDPFVVLAGDLTVSENRLPSTKARQNQKDVVLADFGLATNAGKDLSLENVKFVLNGASVAASTYGALFENVQLQVIANGTTKTFDLTTPIGSDSATSVTYSDTDLGIFLPGNTAVQVKLIADTISTLPAAALNKTFSVTMLTSEAGGFKVIENADDKVVTNIVPSSVTFDNITLVNSTVSISRLSLGDVSVVRGATNVDGIKFQLRTDDVSKVFVNSVEVQGTVTSGTCAFNSTLISAVKLWKQTSTASGGWTLVEQKGGTKIDATKVVFDNFTEIEIPASSTQNFLVTVDVTDDNALAGCEFNLKTTNSQVDDDDNKALTVSVLPTAIGRKITVTGAGSVSIKADNTDTKANRAKHVLAGTTSDYVASFELNAVNEDINAEDLEITAAGAGTATFADAVSEVVVYNDAGTELFRQSVVANTVTFDNVNLTIPQGTMNVYVKVISDVVGKSQNGKVMQDVTLSLKATTIKGKSSGTDVTPTYDGAGMTAATQLFDVIAVQLSNVNISAPAAGTQLTAGASVDLGTVELTANTWSNTNTADNSALKLMAVLLAPQFEGATPTTVTFERTDISTADGVCDATVAGGRFTVNFATCDAAAKEIDKGQTAKFKVKAVYAAAPAGSSARIKFATLDDAASLTYNSSDVTLGTVTMPRIGKTSIDGTQVNAPN